MDAQRALFVAENNKTGFSRAVVQHLTLWHFQGREIKQYWWMTLQKIFSDHILTALPEFDGSTLRHVKYKIESEPSVLSEPELSQHLPKFSGSRGPVLPLFQLCLSMTWGTDS